MADRSAVVLTDILLADDPRELLETLREQLASDPPLALWTAYQAGLRDEFHPASVGDLAEWLQENALAVLQWDEERDGPFEFSSQPAEDRFADQVAHVLEASELAALLAAGDGPAAAESAFLAGLLHDPHGWSVDEGALESISEHLPDWLGSHTRCAAGHLAEAIAVLEGKSSSDPPDFDAQESRRRAEEGRRNWLKPVAGSVGRLSVLAAKLARLEQLETHFQEALETEKLESLAEFAAGAGHEINNPLAIIGGRAQLLLGEEADPEKRRELALVHAQVRRAHEMIADLRLFARPQRPEFERVDLVEFVDALIEDISPQANERATSLTRLGDEGPLMVKVDPTQLNVALRAVCKNSLEAIGHDGRVEISLEGSLGQVLIRVSDDGPGILPEHRNHLFDPFFSARQAGRGLGFGLSKCWRIVTNHGGRIEVESEPGRGAKFTIALPR